jgi:hypothetical protein
MPTLRVALGGRLGTSYVWLSRAARRLILLAPGDTFKPVCRSQGLLPLLPGDQVQRAELWAPASASASFHQKDVFLVDERRGLR